MATRYEEEGLAGRGEASSQSLTPAEASSAGSSGQCTTPASLPETPSDREQLRRAQYKSGGRSRSSEWKEKYRKRCLDRLKQSRERLISQFRQMDANSDTGTVSTSSPLQRSPDSAVQEVMEQEWERMRTEDATLPQITPKRKRRAPRLRPENYKRQPPDYPAFSSDEEYEDAEDLEYVLSIIDELTQELILEEQAMLRQCRERQVELDPRPFEEDLLIAAAMESMTMETSNLMCPICQKDYLRQNARFIYCSCGIQIDSIHDGLSLQYLEQQLESCVMEHSALCNGKPVFTLDCNMGMQNLIMNCCVCDCMFIII